MTFQVGERIICVDDAPHPGRAWYGPRLQKGAEYTVRDYVPPHYADDGPCIRLNEIIRLCDGIGFRASRFRPLIEKKTDISVFTALLTPSNTRTRERV